MVFLFFPLGAPGQQAAVSSQRGAANEKGLAPTLQLAVWGFWPANLFFKSVSRPGHGALPPGGGQDSPESGFCAVLLAKSWGTQTPGLSLPHLWFSKTGADVESRFE